MMFEDVLPEVTADNLNQVRRKSNDKKTRECLIGLLNAIAASKTDSIEVAYEYSIALALSEELEHRGFAVKLEEPMTDSDIYTLKVYW